MSDATQYPLEWIDGYINRLREYIFVREEDCLLIKVPNEAHKMNASAIAILKRLLDGESVVDLWQSHGGSARVQRDLYEFFTSLKQVLQGCVNEHILPGAAVMKPFTLGFNTLPVLSEVALTYRCNLRCRFCYADCPCRNAGGCAPKPVSPLDAEMSTEEAKHILQTIRHGAKVPSVSFTGGEPTLRDDLCALVGYARRELGMRVNLITNGTRIDEALADGLAEAGLNSAQISIEAPEAETHDALTQCEGSFERSLAGLRRLRAARIRVHTNTTLNAVNLDAAPKMPAFVKRLGLERFSMNLIIPAGEGERQEDLSVRYSDVAPVLLDIQREAAREGVEFMWYSPTPICIFNPIQHRLGNKGCAACDGLLSVAPNGDVLPCSSWAEPVGNLLRDDFNGVWNSRSACGMRMKTFAPPGCSACEDFALCQGACPLYWRVFGMEELAGPMHRHCGGRIEKEGAGHVASIR